MNTTAFPTTATQQTEEMFRTISLTALLAGALDLTSAIVKYSIETGKDPIPVFRYIASGAFGKEAFEGGRLMIIWGIVFHFMIAFLFTAFLFLVYPRVSAWIKNKFAVAVFYGLFTWAVMNLVVVPFSYINKYPSDVKQALIAALILILMIGLPVALIADRFYSKRQTPDFS
jgi:hypothetical protein